MKTILPDDNPCPYSAIPIRSLNALSLNPISPSTMEDSDHFLSSNINLKTSKCHLKFN